MADISVGVVDFQRCDGVVICDDAMEKSLDKMHSDGHERFPVELLKNAILRFDYVVVDKITPP